MHANAFLEIMAEEAERMRRLIDNLLSLTRIELNEHNPPGGTVDLAAVARDAAAALTPLADAAGVKVEIAPESPGMVVGDRDELIQVFQNLIHNAIKYGRDKGRVSVAFGRLPAQSRRESGQIFAEVKDEGEGIAPQTIPAPDRTILSAPTRGARARNPAPD